MKLSGIKRQNDELLQNMIDLTPWILMCPVRAQVARDLKNKRIAVKWLRVMRAGLDRLWGMVDKTSSSIRREIKLDKLIAKHGHKLGTGKKRKMDAEKVRRVRKGRAR